MLFCSFYFSGSSVFILRLGLGSGTFRGLGSCCSELFLCGSSVEFRFFL